MLFGAATPAGAADPAPVLGTEAVLRDFMIQNVCLDAAGRVAVGVSPAEADPRCVAQRDLQPGESLPYHKQDHPSAAERAIAPRGYQRHDSYPVETAGLGTVVEHASDFGAGGTARFGAFDVASGDGGDIAVFSPDMVAIGATEDGGSGFQLWVGECQGPVTAAALAHSWIIATYDKQRPAPLEGETVARLNGLKNGKLDTCPARFNAAYTRWAVRPVRYRAVAGQGAPVVLNTLISEHYGGIRRDATQQVERFYFTRELGGTRWEAWVTREGTRGYSSEQIAKAAADFAATGRCSPAEPPAGGAPLVIVDCREWTRIVPPADPRGDPPGFFIREIRNRPETPALFAAPTAGR